MVVEQCPLRFAGRPRGVEDQRIVVIRDLDVTQRRLGVGREGEQVGVVACFAEPHDVVAARWQPGGDRRVGHGVDRGDERGIEQQHRCARVGEEVFDLGRRRGRVDRHQDGAQSLAGVEGDDKPVRVGRHQRHPVALGEAEACQGTGGRFDRLIELGIVQLDLAELEGFGVGDAAGGGAECAVDRGHGVAPCQRSARW